MSAPTRPLVWTVLVASGLAVLIAGLIGTRLILSRLALDEAAVPPLFWVWLAAACGLTVASLGLRALRWAFLMRRGQIRIPIRDSLVGYFSGLALIFVPLLLGEMALRALVYRTRLGVPVAATCVVNLWERYLDLVALAIIAVMAGVVTASPPAAAGPWAAALAVGIVLSLIRSVRELMLIAMVAVTNLATGRLIGESARVDRAAMHALAAHRVWFVALATSVAAWALPAAAFWGLAQSWGRPFALTQASDVFASAALSGGLAMAPGGILIVGGEMLGALGQAGFPAGEAALTVLAIRIATVGLATALGGIFVWVHVRSRSAPGHSHFDTIAHEYDVQIPEVRRLALLAKKTTLMQRELAKHPGFHRGLDVGCGQGWYVARMRQLGFDVRGIDESAGQVATALRNVKEPDAIAVGSALTIPAASGTYDFVYVINVLHHLPTVADQRAAFLEIARVLRPGGLLFLHEINTRNILFRFYMGYVFPSLNCIDEGIERWLLPNRLATYTTLPVIETSYFTFLPDFLPDAFLRLLSPLERFLERSPLRPYSAHYMAVLRKPE